MKYRKFILFTPITLGLVLFIIHTQTAQAQPKYFVKGVVLEEEVDTVTKYNETKIKHFDSEVTWQPKLTDNINVQPEINGVAGILVDTSNDKVLFTKDADVQRPIASLVKVMTAVLALEHKNLNDKIYISDKASSIGENTMGISSGETYTLEELLLGLFMHSGNDAAYAIAEGIAGNSARFTEWMNFKAKELGLENTYFADPSGLNNKSYSTPEDLVKLTRYALKFNDLKRIGATLETTLTSESHKDIYLYNQTNLLSTYPGVKGFKTGYTAPAGLCLITYAENNGVEVIGVVLNSNDRKGDMILMLDHGFNALGINIVHNLL